MDDTRPLKRIRQACEQCRRKKSKCSGERPTCSTCWRLEQHCFYNGEPLQPTPYPSDIHQNAPIASFSMSPSQVASDRSSLDNRMVTLESTVSRILDTLQSTGATGRTQDQGQSVAHSRRTDDSPVEVTISPLSAIIGGGTASEQVKMVRKRDIEALGETYLMFAADQPLPLFPREDFIKSLFERPESALFAIIANAMRYKASSTMSPNFREARAFRDAAHSLALDQIGRGQVEISTLQTLCLIVFYDYSDGDTVLASSMLALTSMLAQNIDFRTKSSAPSHSAREESRCCYWSITLLRNLFGLVSPSSTSLDAASLPYPSSCFMPASAVLRPDFRQAYEQSTGNNGIMVDPFEMSKEWVKVIAYIRACLSFVPDVSPWLTTSRYAAAMAGVMSIETRLQPLHRYHHFVFRDLTLEDLDGHREYWAPWLLSRFLYHTMVCLLNHPLAVTLQLQANGNDSELFRQQSSFYVTRHVRWLLFFIGFIEARGFRVTDPILGYCAAVVATIESQLAYSVDEVTAQKKRQNIESCRRLIRSLAPSFNLMKNLDQKLGALSEVISNTYASNISRSGSVSVDLSRIRDILDTCPTFRDSVLTTVGDLQVVAHTVGVNIASSAQWIRLSRRPSVDQPDDNESPGHDEGTSGTFPRDRPIELSSIEINEAGVRPVISVQSPTSAAFPDFPADLYFNGISQNVSSWWDAFDTYDPDCPSF